MASRARMGGQDDPIAMSLPAMSEASAMHDGLGDRFDWAQEKVVTFGHVMAETIARDVGAVIGDTVEGILMMEDSFKSVSDALSSMGDMARRVLSRLIADLT